MERIISTNIVVYKSLWSRYILGYISLWSGYILVILQYTTVYGEDILQIYCRIQQFMERIYSRFIVGYNSLWSGYILVILQDTTVYGADIFYARYLRKQNFVLWASNSDTPDFGGKVGRNIQGYPQGRLQFHPFTPFLRIKFDFFLLFNGAFWFSKKGNNQVSL